MNLDVRNKDTYKSNVQKLKDMFMAIVPTASVSVGSVLYDLVIRPISVLVTSIAESFETSTYLESLAYLSTSTNREPGRADYVLSNYFITRNEGKDATGTLTVYSTETQTRIPSGSEFSVAGVLVQAANTTIAIYPSSGDSVSTDDVHYIDAYQVGDLYCFSIQVTTVDQSDRIIPEGAPAEALSYIPGLSSAVLSSAIEGGSAGETDAEMVARAQYTVCSWQGCSNSIQKILNNSGITVYSSMSFDGSDPEMSRVSASPVHIGTSGMVDTYVKTSKYPIGGTVTCSLISGQTDITDKVPKGLLSIDSVVEAASGDPIDYTVVWGSSDKTMTPEGARFSKYQTVAVVTDNAMDAVIHYTYMPYIEELQNYMNRADVRILGTSVVIKSAVPAFVRVTASGVVGSWSTTDITDAIKQYVNGLTVGTADINISDLQEYISNNLPGAYIKSPVNLQTTTYTYDGRKTHISSSISGIIKSPGTSDVLTGRIRFFCTSDMEVSIE